MKTKYIFIGIIISLLLSAGVLGFISTRYPPDAVRDTDTSAPYSTHNFTIDLIQGQTQSWYVVSEVHLSDADDGRDVLSIAIYKYNSQWAHEKTISAELPNDSDTKRHYSFRQAWLGENGSWWIADSERVYRYYRNGTYTGQSINQTTPPESAIRKGTAPESQQVNLERINPIEPSGSPFFSPTSIERGADGYWYRLTADGLVYRFTPGGQYTGQYYVTTGELIENDIHSLIAVAVGLIISLVAISVSVYQTPLRIGVPVSITSTGILVSVPSYLLSAPLSYLYWLPDIALSLLLVSPIPITYFLLDDRVEDSVVHAVYLNVPAVVTAAYVLF